MAGIGHRGFMGRKKGGCIPRYLPNYIGDDISGCVAAFGNMKYFSAYSGDCVGLENIDFGFCGDYLNTFAIDNEFGGVDTRLNKWINQASTGNDAITTLNNSIRYNATTKNIVENFLNPDLGFMAFPTYSEVNGFGYTQPFTVVSLYNLTAQQLSTNAPWWVIGSIDTQNHVRLYNQSGGLLSCDIRSATGRLLRRWSQAMQIGVQMTAVTYDGSNTIDGINLYYNDMSAHLTGTPIVNTPLSSFPSYTSAQIITTTVNGYVHEFVVFDRELNTTELSEVKNWFENNYIIP